MKKSGENEPISPATFVSWNVNGIRAVMKKGFLEFLEREAPDVICVQETKARPDQVEEFFWPAQYRRFWNAAEKPGYSGTAIFSRLDPIRVTYGIGKKTHDLEGRVITAEFDRFFLVIAAKASVAKFITKDRIHSFVIPAKAGIHHDYSILLNESPTRPGMTSVPH